MKQEPAKSSFSPPWFLLIGLAIAAVFVLFMTTDIFTKAYFLSGGKEKLKSSENVRNVTAENWEREVVQGATPVLVDFYADWCSPCRALAPTIDKIADDYAGKVKVFKVNIDDEEKLAAQYGIRSIPCVMIFDGSEKPRKVIMGQKGAGEYSRALDAILARK